MIEEEHTEKRKESLTTMSMTPPLVCDRWGASLAIQMNKVLAPNANVTITLKNREDEMLDLVSSQVEEHSVGWDNMHIIFPTQHLAPSLITGSVRFYMKIMSVGETSAEK